ncbi:hypothetical protein LB561_29695 [Mesorhizobium sp. B292B1B]|uniref:hypothetical protein n=1 Tax=unclassified Mesorhizobium TaxID=325217 RepID=UPI00112B00FB|nr:MULTISPECIES: hypothetical protein [unclassified Mesorhizobium]MCA0015512.1 hypothetical protein [Mesorhizobium sp. B294B1A1]MCA0041422.1 hypothetical protein [Mesorhizobium sp. B292B1B]TPM48094.1 hypothetical protein FJ964_11185 [Mesorhizobium sp. B2-3-2]
MSLSGARTFDAIIASHYRIGSLRQFLLVGLVVVISFFMPWTAGGNTDVSWIIIICEKIFSGQKLYVDILETNPPFSVALYIGPVWLSHRLGISPELAIEYFIYLIFVISILLSALVIEKGRIFVDLRTQWVYPMLAVLLLIMPGNIFGQREHIGMMLFMPMLFLMMWRSNDSPGQHIPFALAFAVGLAASVLLLVKPHWALGIALPYLVIAWRKRSLMACLTVENIVIGAICTTYLASVRIWFPEFLDTFLPLLMRYYVSLRANINILVALPTFVVFVVFIAFQMRKSVWRSDVTIAVASGAGFFVSMAYLGKYWPNHQYPYQLALLIAMLLAVASRRQKVLALSGEEAASERANARLHSSAAFAVVVALTVTHHQFYQVPEKSLVDAIKARYSSPSIVQVSSDLSVGNPLARMVNGRWLSAYAHDWVGAHALWGLMKGNYHGEDERIARHDLDNYTLYVNSLIRDNKPDIILVDRLDKKKSVLSLAANYPPIWTVWMRQNADFQALMSNYDEIALGDYIEVYARRSSAH